MAGRNFADPTEDPAMSALTESVADSAELEAIVPLLRTRHALARG